jgi:ribosomal protein L13E
MYTSDATIAVPLAAANLKAPRNSELPPPLACEADPACAVMRARRRNATATASEARVARPLRLTSPSRRQPVREVGRGRRTGDGGAGEELGPYGLDTQRMLRALEDMCGVYFATRSESVSSKVSAAGWHPGSRLRRDSGLTRVFLRYFTRAALIASVRDGVDLLDAASNLISKWRAGIAFIRKSSRACSSRPT